MRSKRAAVILVSAKMSFHLANSRLVVIMRGKSMMLRLFDALKTPPDFFFQDELSFNPYQDKNGLYSDIAKLTPSQYKLVRGFVDNLKEQE